MKVSAGFFTNNSEVFCRMTLPKTMLWADRIVILDLGSLDDTKKYCESILRPQDSYIRRQSNTVPTRGFDEAFNYLLNESQCDWAYVSGINYCVDWKDPEKIKETLRKSPAPLLNVQSHHLPLPRVDSDWVQDIDSIIQLKPTLIEYHQNFIDTKSGIKFKGYIHEEPCLGDTVGSSLAENTDIVRYHFGGWLDNRKKQMRHAYMICRAKYDRPDLQAGINPYWFGDWFELNKHSLIELTNEYKWMFPHELIDS